MEKVATVRDVQDVLVKTAGVLRNLANRNRELEAENAGYRRRTELTKIASDGVTRGVLDGDDITSFVDRWAEDATPLQVIGDFVERTPVGVSLGELGEGPEKTASADGEDALTSFLTNAEPGAYRR